MGHALEAAVLSLATEIRDVDREPVHSALVLRLGPQRESSGQGPRDQSLSSVPSRPMSACRNPPCDRVLIRLTRHNFGSPTDDPKGLVQPYEYEK